MRVPLQVGVRLRQDRRGLQQVRGTCAASSVGCISILLGCNYHALGYGLGHALVHALGDYYALG